MTAYDADCDRTAFSTYGSAGRMKVRAFNDNDLDLESGDNIILSPGNDDEIRLGSTEGGITLVPETGNNIEMWRPLHLKSQTVTNAASAGTEGDVPSQVAGYLSVDINGTTYKLPFYEV